MIALKNAELLRIQLRARMPFRYGIVTMTEVPHVFLRLTFEIDGRAQEGLTADHLPPKWLTKDPARAIADEIEEMLMVIRAAVAQARVLQGADAIPVLARASREPGRLGGGEPAPPLARAFRHLAGGAGPY